MTVSGQQDHVVVTHLVKRYGGALAVNVDEFTIRKGEIHGLVGENGAGKSTLCKIIAGVVTRDSGEVLVNGREVDYRSPKDALADGVTLIAQEVALVPKQSVLSNVFLGNESSRFGTVSKSDQLKRYAGLDKRVGFGIPPEIRVERLSFGDQQKVEILRAIARETDLLILDEPTASLGQNEAELLFRALRGLRDAGTTIVFISHHLKDVIALCDTVTILRDGRVVRTAPAADETEQTLIQGMLGRPMNTVFPEKRITADTAAAAAALSVRGLSRKGVFSDVSFDVHPGEIVGLAGLVGAGRSEVARALFGADALDSGEVRLDGRAVRFRSPKAALRGGLAMVPESRRDQGLVLGLSVQANLTLVRMRDAAFLGVLSNKKLRDTSERMIEMLDIRAKSLRGPVGNLSGGNQQKVLFGKWLVNPPRVLIADEPTRGVDVGAKRAIYQLIADLAAQGLAVLLISSELEEILGLSHRVLVMRRGRLSASLRGDEISEMAIMTAAFSPDGMAS